MRAIKGPAVFLAQFAGDAPPFNSLAAIAAWAARLGFKGVQIPSWDRRLFDLEKAAESQTYCDDVRGVLAEGGLQVTELSTHLQGQLVAVHPAYDTAFDGFAAQEVRGKPQARRGREQHKEKCTKFSHWDRILRHEKTDRACLCVFFSVVDDRAA